MDIRICAYCCSYYSHDLGCCNLSGLDRIALCPFSVQNCPEREDLKDRQAEAALYSGLGRVSLVLGQRATSEAGTCPTGTPSRPWGPAVKGCLKASITL